MLCTSMCFLVQTLKLAFRFFDQLSDYKMIVIIRTLIKHRNFFWCFVSQVTDTMCCAPIFPCVMTMISDFAIVFILPSIKFFLHMWQNVCFLRRHFLFFTVDYFSCILKLHKTSSQSPELCRNHVFSCYQMNSVWIMNNNTPFVCSVLMWRILLNS